MLKLFVNKKLNNLCLGFACVLFLFFIAGAIAFIIKPQKNIENPTNSTSNNAYNISYYAVENGEVGDIYTDMYKIGGNYPTSYSSDDNLYIDDLLGKMSPVMLGGTTCYIGSSIPDRENPNKDYAFYGWYTDSACTISFQQGKRYAGNLTLYAKIMVSCWTPSF